MKLEELRELLRAEAPKMETHGLVVRAVAGVDVAATSTSVFTLTCGRCDRVTAITPRPGDLVADVACPHCDGACTMCGRTHADGKALRVRETGTEKRRVCDDCRNDYYDIFLDVFSSVKHVF